MAYGATKDVENAQADADEAALAAALGKRQGALKVVAIGLVAAALMLGYVAAPAGRRTATAFSSLTCDALPDCEGCVKQDSGGVLFCKKKMEESQCQALKNSAWCPNGGEGPAEGFQCGGKACNGNCINGVCEAGRTVEIPGSPPQIIGGHGEIYLCSGKAQTTPCE
mmetsp:Transcript_33467/g.100987  ORF Transcript_33467/g.100987 Transcript_33467/m.100987 type:complete len:167 (+) Transcript_33467:330-830(+)